MKLGSTDTLKLFIGSIPITKIFLNGNQLYSIDTGYDENYLLYEIVSDDLNNIIS